MSEAAATIQTMAGAEAGQRLLKSRTGPKFCLGTFGGYSLRVCDLHIPGLPASLEGMRIVHLSDMHLRPRWHRIYEKVLAEIQGMDADLILCSGDIVDDKVDHRPSMKTVTRFFAGLRSRLGLYTVLGNHDNPQLGRELGREGVNVISGQRELVANGELELIGSPGHLREHLDRGFVKELASASRGCPRIVLAHYPDHYPVLSELEPDVYLCGHTHGGQVCLPGGVPLMCHDSSPRKHCVGRHRFGRTHYLVNHGLGFSGYLIRMFCPPEIVVMQLRGQQPSHRK